jgi:hypothetical protein
VLRCCGNGGDVHEALSFRGLFDPVIDPMSHSTQ